MSGVKGRSGLKTRRFKEIQDTHRDRIQASMILNALTNHILGKSKMESTQVSAALGLLKKVLPDLTAAEIKSEIEHRYVAKMPDHVMTPEEWQEQHAPKTIQ